MKFSKLTNCLLIAIIISGCTTVRLGNISSTRENYNKAIDNSENEQFLLNIIRVHYNRTPYFVNVDSITTNTTLSSNFAFDNISNTMRSPGATPGINYTFSPNIAFTEAPTITYTPLQGTKFISGLLVPLDIQRIAVLSSSGWDTAMVLNLTINRIGHIHNEKLSKHVTESNAIAINPDFDKFVAVIDKLSIAHEIKFSMTKYNNNPAILLQTNNSNAAQQISKLLGVNSGYSSYIFTDHEIGIDDNNSSNIIPLQTRSLMGIMNYLARGVSDDTNDNSSLVNSPFKVLISDQEPYNTAIKIKYDNGKWYYIKNDDESSKSLMVLLKLIYSLQLGDMKANIPVVTIPVNPTTK